MILYKGRPQTDADAACHVDPPSACGSRTSTVLSTHQELELLDDEANVYKLVGPALIKQDLVEAKSNVSKRVEYIKNEMYVPCPWVPGHTSTIGMANFLSPGLLRIARIARARAWEAQHDAHLAAATPGFHATSHRGSLPSRLTRP
eukprot:scaffold102_cov340-Pavlova_lutheri.AAC.70